MTINNSDVSCPIETTELQINLFLISPYVIFVFLWVVSVQDFFSLSCVFSSVQSLSHVRLFATPWTAARQASLSFTISSWTIKKVEHQITDAFKLWRWRTLLRVPWTSRRSNQSILKEINPEYSLERLMLKLKIQYFGHLMWKANSIEKTLMLGKIQGKRSR